MKLEILTSDELRKIKGGDAGSDLSNTVQEPIVDPDPDETVKFKAGSDLSNTVQ